jgi:hypothetical protein
MLLRLERLCAETEGRYATDAELMFFQDYLATARLRFALYQKLQQLEPQLIQQVLQEMKTHHPALLQSAGTDMTAKWRRDTVRTLRYIATALLLDDGEIFKERMLLWFQTIMKSFHAEQSCAVTYKAMQTAIAQTLTPEEANLLMPFLEMSRVTLGNAGIYK